MLESENSRILIFPDLSIISVMSNLQKFSKHTFLKIFIFTLICSVQIIYTQNLGNTSQKSISNETLKSEESIFTKPLTEIWNFPAQNLQNVTDTLNASDNVLELLLSTSIGKIIKVNTSNGEKIWESDLGGDTVSTPLIFENNIYLTNRPIKNVINVNANDSLVKADVNSQLNSENAFYLIVRAINKENGLTKWQTKISSKNDETRTCYLFSYENNLIVIDDTGVLTALSKEDGTIKWSKTSNFTLTSPPFISDNTIALASSEKQIVFISAKDGEVVNKFSVPVELSALFYDSEAKKLIWGSRKGNVSAFKLDFKELPKSESSKTQKGTNWKFKNGAEISHINSTERGFLISSFDNFLYLISKDKGGLIWKKRLSGRIAAPPLVYKNFIIVTNIAEPTASILDLNSGKTINKISLPNDSYFICSPIFVKDKLILTTQRGIFAFEASNLKQ